MKRIDLRVQPGELDPEALEQFARCMRHDTTGGLQSVEEIAARGQVFEIRDGADQVAVRYVVELAQYAHGRELVVLLAAGGAGGLDMTHLGMQAILHQAAGAADAVTLFTRRKGLIKKLAPLGFTIDGFKLRHRVKRPCS